MREADFTSEVMASIREIGGWCYKIADSPTSWTRGITKFTPDKPCDVVACLDGVMVAIECKQLKKFAAFGRTQMRESQITALTEIVAAGGKGYVFLNIRIKAIKGKQKHENRLIIFDWDKWGDRLSGNDTIKQKDLLNWTHITGKDGLYDLKSFYGRNYG